MAGTTLTSNPQILTDLISDLLKAGRDAALTYLVQGDYMEQKVADHLQNEENEVKQCLLIGKAVGQLLQRDETKAEELRRVLTSSKARESLASREEFGQFFAKKFCKLWNMAATKIVADHFGPKIAALNLPFNEIQLDIRGIKVLDVKLSTSPEHEQQQNVHETTSAYGSSFAAPSTSSTYATSSRNKHNIHSYSGDGSCLTSQQRGHLVRPATVMGRSESIYKMTSNPRGYCIIINNVEFKNRGPRYGSDAEVQFLKPIFEELLFDVKEHRNLKGAKMRTVLEAVAQDPKLSKHDAFTCIILSHGDERGILGVDKKPCPLESLIEIFNSMNCPQLATKPKMFFIQACRGVKCDLGVALDGDFGQGMDRCVTDDGNTDTMATLSNFYICYPSFDGYSALRNEETGSWFGNCLGQVIRDYAWKYNLGRIIEKVTEQLNRRIGSKGHMQSVCAHLIGWDKRLYFNPGLYESA